MFALIFIVEALCTACYMIDKIETVLSTLINLIPWAFARRRNKNVK